MSRGDYLLCLPLQALEFAACSILAGQLLLHFLLLGLHVSQFHLSLLALILVQVVSLHRL